MTIQATITRAGAAARYSFVAGKLSIETTNEPLREEIEAVIHARHPGYNPRLGGPYAGFDFTREPDCFAALETLKAEGFSVAVHEAPEATVSPVPYFGPRGDPRDEEARARAACLDAHADPFPVDDADEVAMPYSAAGKSPRKRPP